MAKQAEVNDRFVEGYKGTKATEESGSPLSSPVVLTQKKNKDLQFSVEYRS
jgi:hypothetical protein